MNITLRCRGSKREQARPPICAARRRAHRRAGSRGDQTNTALNARVRPNRPHGYRCRGSCSCRPCQASAARSRRAAGAFFSVSWASWASTTSPSNAPSSLSRVDAVEWKPCAQWSPPGPVSQPMSAAPCSVCCRTLARHRHWTSSRSRISVARSELSASVSRQAQPSRPPKSSSTS
jgi:hypothetical protein